MTRSRSVLYIFLLGSFISANAQKLPNVQQGSLRAPVTIKIDGKASEWNNEFQAYNKSTSVFYTMSNDDDNLYLILQSKDPLINKKIVSGGITLTINNSDKRNADNSPAVTFPMFNYNAYATILALVNRLASNQNTSAEIDSVRALANKDLVNDAKEIKVKGIKTITDTSISVYNDNGIKAILLLDNANALTYELAIPLKSLGLYSKQEKKFLYNIMLNGIASRSVEHKVGDGYVASTSSVPRGTANSQTYMTINFPTDFWGEYTLAKK